MLLGGDTIKSYNYSYPMCSISAHWFYMKKATILFILAISVLIPSVRATYLLVPMDETQRNHLKAYGIAYYALERDVEVTWLLNYRGGSFMMKYADAIERECRLRGVSVEAIAD